MPIKIIATGDIHIGKKSSGVPAESDEISTKSTWNHLVEMTINENADALALTGDIVDHDNRFFEAVGPLQAGFEKLREAQVDVFIIAGNHDYDVLNQVADASGHDHVHVLGVNGKWEEQTLSKDDRQVRFVGWSFPQQHVNIDPLSQFNIPHSEIPTIGLLHADVDVPESQYAPVSSDVLSHQPVDAWILGHIHKKWTIREDAPFIAYPGSPHAMSAKEQGVHGPFRITVESKNNIYIEQIPLSPVRYETLNIDVTGSENEEMLRKVVLDIMHHFRENNKSDLEKVRHIVLDLFMTGEHPNNQKIESWMSTIKEGFRFEYTGGVVLSVRKVLFNISPAVENMEELARESSPAGLMAETILAIEKGQSTPLLEELLKKWKAGVDRINNTSTYGRLKNDERTIPVEDNTGKEEIKNECRRILGELLNQKSQ
ncbi:MAG: DNA repair exonuclease [Marinilabilia sp.]